MITKGQSVTTNANFELAKGATAPWPLVKYTNVLTLLDSYSQLLLPSYYILSEKRSRKKDAKKGDNKQLTKQSDVSESWNEFEDDGSDEITELETRLK